ncbi:hypothetical protein AHAS_Ahas15G0193700 [Arachis hypogaea]
MPLEFEGVARQHKKSTMACHLRSKAWHAKVERGMSVPLEGLGVAHQAGNDEHVTRQRHASHTPAEKSSINTPRSTEEGVKQSVLDPLLHFTFEYFLSYE